jgi:hypothetical protein
VKLGSSLSGLLGFETVFALSSVLDRHGISVGIGIACSTTHFEHSCVLAAARNVCLRLNAGIKSDALSQIKVLSRHWICNLLIL